MPISELRSTAVVRGAAQLDVASFFGVTAGASLPTYLVVNVLDRNEYTAASNSDTGVLSGNGVHLALTSIGGDGRGCGIVFTWQASTDQYVNATYGRLSQLTYTASANPADITSLSLFGTGSATLAQQNAGNAYALMQADAGGYIGSATIATAPHVTAAVRPAATPDGVAAAAMTFVGQAWNQEGCWVLASTIAAEAGTALPVQSTVTGIAGHANGEWIVLYNGPQAAKPYWPSLVATGDVVTFATPGGGGHITTCVSGSGATAMLVDNITYVNQFGAVINPANDGAAADIVVAAPHIALQEWSGVAADSVVIYALDTPCVTDRQAAANLTGGNRLVLASLFSATDPAHRAVTAFQLYDTGAGSIVVNGVAKPAHSAATALTVTSLGAAVLQAGMTPESDTVEVRAFNGLYWGDWHCAVVTVNPPAPAPPVLIAHTANQVWRAGTHIGLILPAALFSDPRHEALTYAATQANGMALPHWLSFTPSRLMFAGTVPTVPETLSITITATDTSRLASSETFGITVPSAGVAALTVGDWLIQTGAQPMKPASGTVGGFCIPAPAAATDIAWAAVHHP